MPKKALTRVQFDFSKDRVADIEKLKVQLGVSTRKDVFESALTLLEWAVEQVGNGRDLGAFDNQTATFHGVVMPGLRKRR